MATKPRRFQSPKYLLFRIHQDLAKIVMPFESGGSDDLTDIEVLIILLEDRRFFEHSGIDFKSVFREFIKLCTFRKHGGASTIDMQFVRTRTGYKTRKLTRKSYEMLLAYFLQFRMGKLAILRAYLQIMYLGSGLYGVDSAARKVFEKPIYLLNIEEAAFIAAMMVYPRPLNPTPNWREIVQRRANYGLRLFRTLGGRYKQRFE